MFPKENDNYKVQKGWTPMNKPWRNKKNQQGGQKLKHYQNLQKLEREKKNVEVFKKLALKY